MTLPAVTTLGSEAVAVTFGTGVWLLTVLAIASGSGRSAVAARRRR